MIEERTPTSEVSEDSVKIKFSNNETVDESSVDFRNREFLRASFNEVSQTFPEGRL